MVNIYTNLNKNNLNKMITSDLEKLINRMKTLTTAFIAEQVNELQVI